MAERHHLEQVILFGSRARGDYGRASDIDLAVKGGDLISFTLDIEEKTSTLLMYDVVNLNNKVQENLLEAIFGEGVMVYEKI